MKLFPKNAKCIDCHPSNEDVFVAIGQDGYFFYFYFLLFPRTSLYRKIVLFAVLILLRFLFSNISWVFFFTVLFVIVYITRSIGTWDMRMLAEKGKNKALSFVKAPKVGSGAYFSPNSGNKLIYTTYDNFVRYV